MAGPDDIDHVQIALFDQTVEMDIDEVVPGGSAPMPKQTRFDVFELERGFEQRIVLKINLPDREVIWRRANTRPFFPADRMTMQQASGTPYGLVHAPCPDGLR